MPAVANPSVRRHLMLAKLETFSEAELFKNVADPDMDWLTRAATATTFTRGQVLVSPGRRDEIVYWLKRGHVEISRPGPSGAAVRTLEPGTLFGQMPLLGMTMSGLHATALSDCNVLVLDRAALEDVLAEHCHLALKFLDIVGHRLVEAEARLEDITFKSIPGRLASLLLRLAPGSAGRVQGYTHQDLAEMIGTYRETTTQTLNQFKSKGMVDIGRKRIDIRDRDALRRLAEQ